MMKNRGDDNETASPDRTTLRGSRGGRALPMKKRKSFLLESDPADSKKKWKEEGSIKEKRQDDHDAGNGCEDGYGGGKEGSSKAVKAEAGEGTSSVDSDGVVNKSGNGDCHGITPQINDVLMESSPTKPGDGKTSPTPSSTFHHIGNRRFRVLVEVNLSNYFGGVTTEEQWESVLSKESQRGNVGRQRDGIAKSIIMSVEGNNPAGRFLVRKSEEREHDEKKSGGIASADDELGSNWRLANRDEIESKVHATFMAAGRFHAKSVAALARAPREAEQATAPEGGLEGVTADTLAAATAVEMDAEPAEIAALTASTVSSAPSILKNDAPSSAEDGVGTNEGDISEALARYHAKNQEAAKSKLRATAASLQEALLAGSSETNSPARTKTAASSKTEQEVAGTAHAEAMVKNEKLQGSEKALYEALLTAAAATTSSRKNARPSAVVSNEATSTNSEIDGIGKEPSKISTLTGSKSYCPTSSTRRSLTAKGDASFLTASGGQQLEQQQTESTSFPTSISELFAAAAAAKSRNSATLSDSTTTQADVNGDIPCASGNNEPKDLAPMPCPPRIKVFLALPMDRFFVEEEQQIEGSVTSVVSPTGSPPLAIPPAHPTSSYLVPSNYDVLCGPGQAFFHHVGNRRFRIMVEMNAQRYEDAYLTSVASTSSAPSKDGEATIQKLIDEVLSSLSRCDPPGRMLGMDMATGRWRVLNPVYAQLKVEQTFYECVKVGRRRRQRERAEHQRAMQEMALRRAMLQAQVQGQGQPQEEWRRRIELEKEALLEELERRVSGGAAPLIARRRVSQESLSDGVAALACSVASRPPSLANEDLSTLQSQARATLRRRQAPPAFGYNANAAAALGEPDAAAVMEAMQITSCSQRTEASRALLDRLQNNNAASALPQQRKLSAAAQLSRRSSLPVMSSLAPSLASQRDALTATAAATAKRGSELSRGSDSGEVGEAARSSLRHSVSSSSSCVGSGSDSGHHDKDIMDVVGGMMMMARRGSC